MFVELVDNVGLGGAAHRNMKWNYWELEFAGDIMFRCDAAFNRGAGMFATNISVRCTFEINLAMLFYQYSGALHL